MQLIKELNKKYNKYVDKNRDKLLNDFCKEIKELEIGNLTLGEYTKFRFWKEDQVDSLTDYYKQFQNDTKDYALDFDSFCKVTWQYMEDADIDILPKEVRMILDGLRNEGSAEA